MLLKKIKSDNQGNISLLTLGLLVVFSVFFIVLFDICQIFIVREETKKASDAASLAAAQNLLFFEKKDCSRIAEDVAQLNGCSLVGYSCNYDEVMVTVEKKVDFIILDKFTGEHSMVTSKSRAGVIYPWDEQFDYCDYYRFKY